MTNNNCLLISTFEKASTSNNYIQINSKKNQFEIISTKTCRLTDVFAKATSLVDQCSSDDLKKLKTHTELLQKRYQTSVNQSWTRWFLRSCLLRCFFSSCVKKYDQAEKETNDNYLSLLNAISRTLKNLETKKDVVKKQETAKPSSSEDKSEKKVVPTDKVIPADKKEIKQPKVDPVVVEELVIDEPEIEHVVPEFPIVRFDYQGAKISPRDFVSLVQLAAQTPHTEIISFDQLKALDFSSVKLTEKEQKQFYKAQNKIYCEAVEELVITHTNTLVPLLLMCPNVKKLNLQNCSGLTSNILPLLMKRPKLTHLRLPDNLYVNSNSLPKFSNPLDIAKCYLSSKNLLPFALKCYTGPAEFAVVFQIGLARAGITKIFSPTHDTLDTTSTFFWLYDGDYQKLPPCDSVTKILGDYVFDDKNLVPFLKKFPNVRELSLRGCAGITDEGVAELLAYCLQKGVKITHVDLTDCKNVTNVPFYGDIPQKLSNIKLSGTGVTSDIATFVKQDKEDRYVEAETRHITLQDDQLDTVDHIDGSSLISINLYNCTKLTDDMLGKLLDRLSLADKDPKKLKIAELNLTGCTQITDKAFLNQANLKPLDTLARIYIEGTQITQELVENYAAPDHALYFDDMSVQDPLYNPYQRFCRPDMPLTRCLGLLQTESRVSKNAKEEALQKKDGSEKALKTILLMEAPLSILTHREKKSLIQYVTDHFFVHLFPHKIKRDEQVKTLPTIDPNDLKFTDLTIYGKNTKPYMIRKDFLSNFSSFYRKLCLPGGDASKKDEITIVDDEATQEALDLVFNYITTKQIFPSTKPQVLEDAYVVALELCKDREDLQNAILKELKQHFTLDNASEFLNRTDLDTHKMLKVHLENWLIEIFKQPNTPIDGKKFQNLAISYSLDILAGHMGMI